MKYLRLYIATTSLAVILSGCSTVSNIFSKKEKATTVTGADAREVAANNNDKMGKESSQKRTDVPPQIVGPQIQPVVTPMPSVEDTVATVEPKVTELTGTARVVGGSWTIVQVGSHTIDRDEDMPYIVFVPGDGSFYANNGCNTLNGSYTMSGDKIAFHNVLSTMRLCPDVNFDHEINTVIADETLTDLKVTESGSETILDFVTPGGKILLRLRRANLEFLNGQWEIISVAGLQSLKEPATVFFDLTDLKFHGNTGCNFINGEIYLDHRTPNAVDLSQIITTLRACPYPAQQTAILVALEQTTSAISDGADKVELLDHDGKILLELKRASGK